jgi:hypothetical protein
MASYPAIIKGKNYSIKDLQGLFGEKFIEQIPGRIIIPWKELNEYLESQSIIKKPILHFDEFDEETKKIYKSIKKIVLSLNHNQKSIKVWATGSRIYGTWRTNEEEDIIAHINNKKPKYSDYDYCTDARTVPSIKIFMEQIGVKVDHSDCDSSKKILIP